MGDFKEFRKNWWNLKKIEYFKKFKKNQYFIRNLGLKQVIFYLCIKISF